MASRFRFSLRGLLLLPLLVGGALALYRMPFTITSPPINRQGDYRRLVVRFGWDGDLHHHGAVTTYSRDGQKRVEFFEYGKYAKWWCLNIVGRPGAKFWDETGREITCEEYMEEAFARQASR